MGPEITVMWPLITSFSFLVVQKCRGQRDVPVQLVIPTMSSYSLQATLPELAIPGIMLLERSPTVSQVCMSHDLYSTGQSVRTGVQRGQHSLTPMWCYRQSVVSKYYSPLGLCRLQTRAFFSNVSVRPHLGSAHCL